MLAEVAVEEEEVDEEELFELTGGTGGACLDGRRVGGAGIGLLGYFGLGNSVVWAAGLLLGAIGIAILAYGIYAKKNNLDENA